MIGYEDIPLLKNLSRSGEPPRTRLKDAAAGRSLFVTMRNDDLISAANRAEHQDLLDNAPPYRDSELREANMSGMTNLNFGGAEQKLERAMSPYYRLIQSPEDLVNVFTLYGPEDERGDINAILSEEISRTIRSSETFAFQTLLCIQRFVRDGVGVLFFPDEDDWRYRGAGLGQFYFDRQRMACESEQQVVCATEEYSVTRLYEAIRDGVDEDSGWNEKAVKLAVQKGAQEASYYNDWERLQEEFKNNDLQVSQICPPVTVIHLWVREFDSTWSHYMTTEDDLGSKEFLYVSRGNYRSLSEAMVIFPYGLGTNAKIHGIRGLLYKIYPHEQQFNRSVSRMIDQGVLSSSLILQAGDESTLSTIGLQYLGNTAVVGPDWKAVQLTMPDLQRSVMPSIELMQKLGNDRSAGYSSENVFDGDQRRTKFEVAAHLESSAELSDSALDFFYGPFERAQQQSVRRMTRRDYLPQDPGGREVRDMLLRILKRGVPLEAFYRIDHKATKVVRAIGAGSASAKTLAIQRGEELYPRMDDVGQAHYNRMKAVDIWGAGNADLFIPRDGQKRTTVETSVAILQNNDLLEGKEVPVLSSDKHMAHAREHIKPLMEGFEAAEGGQATMAEVATQMRLLYMHAAEHVDYVSGDPEVQEEAAMMREVMQQVGEVISNGMKEAEKMAQEAAESGEGEGQEGPDPEQIREFERHRQKMEQAQEAFNLKMDQEVRAADVNIAIKDATAAAEIARKRKTQQ